MKRIILVLLACLLLAACKTPTAAGSVTPEAEQKRAQTEPDMPETVGEPQTGAYAEDTVPGPAAEPEPERKENEEIAQKTAAVQSTPEPLPAWADPRFPGKFSEKPEMGERSYKSSSVDITITTYTVKDTYAKLASYHVADIYVKDVTSIRTAAANSFDTRYEDTVKNIAKNAGALLAIDGDTYTHVKKSFVIRNGTLYRDTPIENTDICILYRDGRMETKKWGEFTLEEVVASDPWQVWGFGPALLDENGHALEIEHKLSAWNPRAVIGYYEPGHYCFVIVDGRDHNWSEGVRLTALSRLMEDLGCKAAYNLDGGDSAQMYWNGEIISKSRNESRVISDIIYVLPEE